MDPPVVSVAVANFNGGRFIEQAIGSALAQDLAGIEVIVVDDGSDDDSLARAMRIAERDRRVRVERLERRRGPGAARNRAMDLARGRWFAVLGGEDLMHPARLARLVTRAQRDGAGIVADDLLVFEEPGARRVRRLLRGARARGPTWLTAGAFLQEPRLLRSASGLGGLKPMIELEAWRATGVRYDEAIPVGEDHDLLLRLLGAGLSCRIDPFIGYLHRRRASSASHRPSGLTPDRTARASTGRQAWFISRQRLIGRTNGSSTYLLDLAEATRRLGFEPHLLQPSPSILGRWPVLWLKPDMKVFASIRWRGVLRLGPLILARDPMVYLAALRALLAHALARAGLPSSWLKAKPAPFAPAAPWTDEDRLHVARIVRGRADVLIADYCWQTEALAYALSPRARTAVVMHDLSHQRAASFEQRASSDPVPSLDRETEIRLLARADAIVAIQKAEAEAVARLAPGRRILVVPMTARPVPTPQPGDPRKVLFVGSNTAPNVDALMWMFEEIWPHVRSALPDLELLVAGAVSRAGLPAPEGVRNLGFVARLDELYARAGLVVSPLRMGSGLKIKLVEALAHGKACVATSVTLQGVEQETAGAVALADAPDAFAAAVIRLASDEQARVELGARALAAARASFAAEPRQAEFGRWLRGQDAPGRAADSCEGRSPDHPARPRAGRL